MVKGLLRSLLLCFVYFHMAAGLCCPGLATQNCSVGDNLIRLASGTPIGDKLNVMTVGPRGPIVLHDRTLFEEVAHFNRQRIPNRVVHAKGNGAFGYFEVTDNVTMYSKAKVFGKKGNRTPIAVRFSIGGSDIGIHDSVRDLRGFSIKFYTEEGNWDMANFHMPVAPAQDPLMFMSFTRTFKPHPESNIKDTNRFWDITSMTPETSQALMYLFGDHGIPHNYRRMNGYSVNTFRCVNSDQKAVYCRFILKSDQGQKGMSAEDVKRVAASDPDRFTKDLYDAIENGDYPSWTLYVQVMALEKAHHYKWNPFNPTFEWTEGEFPPIRVGKLLLNRNPQNFFAEIEQLAFSPANLVPGIEYSPDKFLQGRIFAYTDTQRYRLGSNYRQLPVNCPFRSPANNYERDGRSQITDNGGGGPNYFPNSYGGPVEDRSAIESSFRVCGIATRIKEPDVDYYFQATNKYKKMGNPEKNRLARNLAEHLGLAEKFIQERQLLSFRNISPDLEVRTKKALDAFKTEQS